MPDRAKVCHVKGIAKVLVRFGKVMQSYAMNWPEIAELFCILVTIDLLYFLFSLIIRMTRLHYFQRSHCLPSSFNVNYSPAIVGTLLRNLKWQKI